MVVGYTTGVFDLFHIGHINLLRNAKSLCVKLIVGVTVDELVLYKGKKPIISYDSRVEVVRACRYVDIVIPQNNMDKIDAHQQLKFDIMFVGNDWYNTKKWNEIEKGLKHKGVKIVFFPYTESISSTLVNEILIDARK